MQKASCGSRIPREDLQELSGPFTNGFSVAPRPIIGSKKMHPQAATGPQALPRQPNKSSVRTFASPQNPHFICMRQGASQEEMKQANRTVHPAKVNGGQETRCAARTHQNDKPESSRGEPKTSKYQPGRTKSAPRTCTLPVSLTPWR